MIKKSILILTLTMTLITTGCDDRGINIFSIEDDIDLGDQVAAEILSNPEDYPILNKNDYPEAYDFMNTMMETILRSEKFKYADTFDWEITIINQNVMNAFAVPGGHIYFYTGLIKYLDDSASLAGVMGHEMAHVDLRHSTQVLTKVYGISFLIGLLTGDTDESILVTLAKNLALGAAQLQFSRDHEYMADRYSIYYLSTSKYEPTGIGNFFLKLEDDGYTSDTFEFLSTHPSDENRLDNIDDVWENDEYVIEMKEGRAYDLYPSEYQNELINYLP